MVRSMMLRCLYCCGSKPGGRPPVPSLAGGPRRPFGDRGADTAIAQVGADGLAGVGLVGQQRRDGCVVVRGPGGLTQIVQDRLERQGVPALPGTGHRRQRPAPGISGQVDLRARPGVG